MNAIDDTPFEEIEAKKLASRLARKTNKAYSLNRTVVKGQLDLKNQVIERPVDIQDCIFQGEVNLRYCEFKQTVNLSGCILREKFDSGDEAEAHTIYRKDLICKGVLFEGDVCFVGTRVEGDAHFSKATPEDEARKTIFKGKADFSAFKCSGYGFFQEARFEGAEEVDFTHASFGRSLECDGALFVGKASFHGVSCGNSAFFKNARFQSEQEASFDYASFGKNLRCNKAVFKGIVNFEAVKCGGSAYFEKTRFKGKKQASRDFAIDFAGASFGRRLICKDALFRGPVSFNNIECNGNASFENARFKSKEQASNGFAVDFTTAFFGGQLNCDNAVFKGPVSFNPIECNGNASFENARFKSKELAPIGFAVDFTGASFGWQLNCTNAVFKGPVSFNSIECKDTGFFDNARFRSGKLNLRYASFGRNLSYDDATLEGEETDFRFVRVGSSLSLQRAYFATDVKLSHAYISKKLCLGGSCFKKQVDLYGTEIAVLELLDVHHDDFPIKVRATERQGGMESVVETSEDLKRISNGTQYEEELGRIIDGLYPFKGTSLNLSNTTFKRFHGGPYRRLEEEFALKLAEGQDPKKFNRDPYMQLEEFYRSEGNEAAARNIYYKGRCAYRENATSKDGSARLSPTANAIDWLWKWLTGYGVSLKVLLGITFAFLIAGTLIFYLVDDSLSRVRASEPSTQPGEQTLPTPAGEATVASMPSEEAATLLTITSETNTPETTPDGKQDPNGEEDTKGQQDPQPWEEGFPYRATYSLDQFVPLVNLHVDEKWVPSGPWLHAYMVVHTLVGWLVVPLLIAAFAGVMRR